MKKHVFLLLFAITTFFTSCKDEHKDLPDGLYAEIETTKGNVLVCLEYIKTPITVANFVTLAEGKNAFVSSDLKGKPFYDGLKCHRVISKTNGDAEDFMIQGGDPLGNGSGDAGYKFKDEITDLRFDKKGLIAMANSGPMTNSSQFFITLKDTPWLNGKHTIFGHVVGDGMEVAHAVVKDDGITAVKIIRKGEDAKKFDAVKVFNDYFKSETENQKKQVAIDAQNRKLYEAKYRSVINQKVSFFNAIKAETTKTTSGLKFKMMQKGKGKKPEKGTVVSISYAGFLEDGTLFDTSNANVAKAFGKFDEQRARQNGYSALPFQMGSHNLIPGFVEGLEKMNYGDKAILFIPASLAYGAQGAGNVIPPNANIVFEIELLDK